LLRLGMTQGTFLLVHREQIHLTIQGSQELRNGVRRAYSAAADRPDGENPFPIGRSFAVSLGYPEDLLDGLPAVAVDRFVGVSNVAVFADIPAGTIVLDLGCGAGLDSLIAARRTGLQGRVIGIDFSESMLKCASQAREETKLGNVEFFLEGAESLPIEDGAVDVALVNGIFNLNPARDAIFRELARVVKSGGSVYAAELVLREPLPPDARDSEVNWFA
jgi:arsenite methyltransferase